MCDAHIIQNIQYLIPKDDRSTGQLKNVVREKKDTIWEEKLIPSTFNKYPLFKNHQVSSKLFILL